MHKIFPKLFVFLDQHDIHLFKNINTNIGIIYRNYNAKKREIELIKIAKACRTNRNQLFISNDMKLAIKYKAAGIYIPSFNRTKGFSNLEKRNFKILGSAHNQKQIKEKFNQNCRKIFLSPIFYVKKSKTFLDLHKFNYLTYRNNINIFALGGISEKYINKLKLLNIKGFGGIQLFKKKPALKKAGFYKELLL